MVLFWLLLLMFGFHISIYSKCLKTSIYCQIKTTVRDSFLFGCDSCTIFTQCQANYHFSDGHTKIFQRDSFALNNVVCRYFSPNFFIISSFSFLFFIILLLHLHFYFAFPQDRTFVVFNRLFKCTIVFSALCATYICFGPRRIYIERTLIHGCGNFHVQSQYYEVFYD